MKEAEVHGVMVTIEPPDVLVGLVVARGCTTAAAPPGLDRALNAALEEANARVGEEEVTKPVRGLLRYGGYKPTGRGKPASEYLLKAARTGGFPRINNLVDLNNLVSLRSLLPISLVDLVRADTGRFVVRRGRPNESYIFNSAGQTIALEDLLLVARQPDDEPCANPIKDSMATKLTDASTDVMAVIYAPPALRVHAEAAAARFAEGFEAWTDADAVESVVLVS